jgi:hypothetical protein
MSQPRRSGEERRDQRVMWAYCSSIVSRVGCCLLTPPADDADDEHVGVVVMAGAGERGPGVLIHPDK